MLDFAQKVIHSTAKISQSEREAVGRAYIDLPDQKQPKFHRQGRNKQTSASAILRERPLFVLKSHCAKIEKNNTAGKKSEEASGKKNEGDSSGNPSLNFTETFKLYFQGPRLTVGNSYFDSCRNCH